MNLQELQKGFVEACLEAYNAENDFDFLMKKNHAYGWLLAIGHALSVEDRQPLYEAAQEAVGADVPTCLGVPNVMKNQTLEYA